MTTLPRIVIARSDHAKLMTLGDIAEDLFVEIDRARVVDDVRLPVDAVRMGSRVRYRTEDGDTKEVELVYPAEADIALGRISVHTPVGTALLGLRVGQSIKWRARSGRTSTLMVEGVDQREPAWVPV